MNSSDAQPPLSRRQARERERAAAAGAQPVTPPPSVAAPAEQFEARRRPGSHVAPAPSGPAQNGSAQPGGTSPARPASAAPAPSPVSAALPAPAQTPTSASSAAPTSASSAAPNSASSAAPTAAASASSFPTLPPTSVSEYAPASATEIVPGSGGLTRRQLRQLREAQGQAVQPVPLQNPTPQSSDRTVQDVIGSVDALEVPAPSTRPTSADQADERPEREPGAPALDEAAVAQATEADGSPDAIEPIDEAAAHAEEPRRHRSTWAPHDASTDEVPAVDAGTKPEASGNSDSNSDSDGVALADAVIADGQQPATARSAAAAATPGVFPLSLDEDDTNEVPVQAPASARSTSAQDDEADAPRVPAAFQRQPEPKPITTVFEPPVGHWSQQAHDSNDAEVHDEETGARRVAVTNTNAIVLPSSALADPTGALNATGEVILTGSIDLPASLSSTGSHRPIDGAEVDRLLEQHDEQPETDASPVRASRAISSHTSTRQVVLAAAKPKESRTPLILGVTVGAVGVAAAAVIIVALVTTHAFGG